MPDGTVETTLTAHFVWVEGIDETEFRGTRFNKGVEGISITDNTVTWEAENAMDVLETTVTHRCESYQSGYNIFGRFG